MSKTIGSLSKTTCYQLSDHDSAFTQTMGFLANVSTSELFHRLQELPLKLIDELFPQISRCLGSSIPAEAFLRMTSNPRWDECLVAVIDNQLTLEDLRRSQVNSTHEYLNDLLTKTVCPLYKDTMAPCMHDLVVPFLDDIVATSGGCCDELQQSIQDFFGGNISAVLDTLVVHMGDILCSSMRFEQQQSDPFSKSCGPVLMDSLFAQRDLHALGAFLEASNDDQVCKALKGEWFTSKTGEQAHLFPNNVTALDACSLPIWTFMQEIKNYPLWVALNGTSADNTTRLSDLFEENRCLSSDELLEWTLSSESVFIRILQVLDEIIDQAGLFDWLVFLEGATPLGTLTSQVPLEKETPSDGSPQRTISSAVKSFVRLLWTPLTGKCFHIASNLETCTFSANFVSLSAPLPTQAASIFLRSDATQLNQNQQLHPSLLFAANLVMAILRYH